MKLKQTLAFLLAALLLGALFTGCSGGGNPPPASNPPAATQPAAPNGSQSSGGEVDKSDWVTLNLTYATFLAADAPGQDGIDLLQAKCDEHMGEGYVNIETYANGTLLGTADIFDGVVNGVAEMGIVLSSTLTGRLPVTMVADTAGLYYASSQAGCRAMRDYIDQVQPEELKDVVVLFPISTTPQALCCTKEITCLEDLAGMQIRATSSAADAVKSWNAVPVSMAIGEVYEGLRNGLVEGCISSVGAFGNSKFEEVAKYCLVTPFIGSSNLVVLNRGTYESMPESQRAVFDQCVDETFEEFYSTYIEDFSNDPNSQLYLNTIEKITFLEGEELDKFTQAVQDLPAQYARQLNEMGYEGDKLVELFSSLLEKYNAEYPPVPDNYYMWMKD
ncbi:MAG: TRAP transporter substrate-binding protein DctP [Oscillospiraceae bacterium]|nr:TRAP transporter substrate-binding protein DctP [Oscillospiraceae bacterium]